MKQTKKLKVGDVVYLYRNEYNLYTVTDITTENNKTYCWVTKDPEGICAERYHERFVHPVKDEEAKNRYLHYISPEYKAQCRAQLEAEANWLKQRQAELTGLTFRCYETDLFPQQKELLEAAGYHIYYLTDGDEGSDYNIKRNAWANRFGNWITDIDLSPYMSDGQCINSSELVNANIIDIPYEEVKPYLEEGRKLFLESRGKAV